MSVTSFNDEKGSNALVYCHVNHCIGGVTNFCFGKCSENRQEMFVCAEQRLWHLQFGEDGQSQFGLSGQSGGWLEWSVCLVSDC